MDDEELLRALHHVEVILLPRIHSLEEAVRQIEELSREVGHPAKLRNLFEIHRLAEAAQNL